MEPEKRRKLSTYDQNHDANNTANQNLVGDHHKDCDDLEKLPLSSDGPFPHPSLDLTESLIAQKMSKLSMEDREAAYYDIHGVADVIDEDSEPGFLNRKINEMAIEIDRIDPEEKVAYEMARSTNQSYVDDRNFRLRFLRTVRFNAKSAASRYVLHYEAKLELFGPEKIGRDIVQDDLDDEALEALYCGAAQVLPKRDSAGRLVFFWTSRMGCYSTQAMCRRFFYSSMIFSEDIESQRKGLVCVIYQLNQEQNLRGSQGRHRVSSLTKLILRVPIAVVSYNFCYDNVAFMPILAVCRVSCSLFLQLRFRAHYGTHAECMQKLQSFGIPTDIFPIDENGNIRSHHHKLYFEKRRALERQRASQKEGSSTESIKMTIPKTCDILLGRGKGFFQHVGNVRYRSVIEDHKLEYDQESKEGRQRIAEGIVAMVHDYGGRFLKDDGDDIWVEIDNKSARKKVSHSFRALRSASHKINNPPTAKRIERD